MTTNVPPVTPTSTTRLIVAMVSNRLGVKREEIYARRRARDVLHARYIAIWLLRTETPAGARSLPWIGSQFGRDHTSILNALRKVDDWRQYSPAFRLKSDKVREDVRQMLRMRRAHMLEAGSQPAAEVQHEPV